MHMLIPIDFIILVNYVYVDSVRFYNTCELCICGFYWVLNACKLCVHSTGFLNAFKLCICWFQWMYNACKLCVLIQLGLGILVNTVYVHSNESYNTCKLCICWFYWGFECL